MNEECICQVCGEGYKVDLMIDDVLWEKIKPENKPFGSGLMCGVCIMQKIEFLSDFSAYLLVEI